MSFHLPESIVDRLLELLSQDDEYRSLFVANPRRALADIGFAPAANPTCEAGIWICLKTRRLASKAQIAATRGALRIQLRDPEQAMNPLGLGVSGPDFKAKIANAEKV
jgi:putative modified peptide